MSVRTLTLAFATVAAATAARAEDAPTGRFAIELTGGFSRLDPVDLNARSSYGDRLQIQQYDLQFDALQRSGALLAWEKTANGARPRVHGGLDGGARVSWAFSRRVTVSVGYERLSASPTATWSARYTRTDVYGSRDIESLAGSGDALTAHADTALAGIHVGWTLGRRLRAEAAVRGGVLFARFGATARDGYTWDKNVPQAAGRVTYNVLTRDTSTAESGSGTGVAAEAALRLVRPLRRRFAAFAEGGYAYRRVGRASGSGSETIGDRTASWAGPWFVERERLAAPWGTVELENPTARLLPGQTPVKARDFRLDLSGLALRAGISIAF